MTPYTRARAVTLTLPVVALCAWMLHGAAMPVLIAALFAVVLSPLAAGLRESSVVEARGPRESSPRER